MTERFLIIITTLLLSTVYNVSCCIHEAKNYGTVIGIDLGLSNSCVGVYKKGHVEIIPNEQGNRITPSYVAFTPDGERLIGDAAKNQLTTKPENTIFDVKRLIGRTWDDASVQKDIKYYPFKVINKNNKPHVQVTVDSQKRLFAPEEISAMVLSKMKEIAETYLGENVTHAVITVPAYFNDAQRTATKEAGTIAGLNVLRTINEPVAASVAYGLDRKDGEQNILVFDLGSGTFDVSVLNIDYGVVEIMSTNGDAHLGGEDFDKRVMDYFIKLFKKKTGKDLRQDNRAIQKLRREVEKAKKALSSQHQTRVEIESLLGGADLSETLTRAKFEELNMALFKSTLNPMKAVLDDAEMKMSDIHEIILVGESAEIPKVQQLVKDFFNGKKPNISINPAEAVAYGAAVQGGVLGGLVDGLPDVITLCDFLPLSLGIETVNGVMSKLILRNSFLPKRESQVFSTATDNQQVVSIVIFEGDRPMTKFNHFLGKFDLASIPPAPRGVPQIEVTFELDVNGILTVTAEDKGTGNKNNIVIKNDGNRLSSEEMEKMMKDVEDFAEEDKEIMEKIDARKELESSEYSLKNKVDDKKFGHESAIFHKVDEKIKWVGDKETDEYVHVYMSREIENEDVTEPIISKLHGSVGDNEKDDRSDHQHEDL